MRRSSKIKVYIVLTYTGTLLSKIIKCYTKEEYSHVSLALDKNLNKMYSFGRLNPYNPFIGGFVHEGVNIGTFKRFKNTKALICSLELSCSQYRKLKQIVKKMERKKAMYKFNTIGLFAAAFNIRIRRKYYFYCAEFVKYLLDEANINSKLPDTIKPMDFKKISGLQIEYMGMLKNYQLTY
ncbi:MAG: hypothetical protein PUC82_04570 [bacterium]|nr:hypothetical protein [bacterium]